MSEDSSCESAPVGPSSSPAVSSVTPEQNVAMSSYMKQLLVEKQMLEEKAGLELAFDTQTAGQW